MMRNRVSDKMAYEDVLSKLLNMNQGLSKRKECHLHTTEYFKSQNHTLDSLFRNYLKFPRTPKFVLINSQISSKS